MGSIRYLNVILTLLTVVAAAQLWTGWMAGPGVASVAHAAGIPDSGAQNQQMIDQLKLLNQKTDEIKGLLASGKLRVVTSSDDAKR